MRERRAVTIGAEGECPSVSPDGTHLAFKRRIVEGLQPVHWRLMVLTLATHDAVALSETRSVDDQVQWLDDAHVLYSLPHAESGSAETDTWVANADGSGTPQLLLPASTSAVVVARAVGALH